MNNKNHDLSTQSKIAVGYPEPCYAKRNMALLFSLITFHQNPREYWIFSLPMIYVNIINRQTNLLNCMDLTKVKDILKSYEPTDNAYCRQIITHRQTYNRSHSSKIPINSQIKFLHIAYLHQST